MTNGASAYETEYAFVAGDAEKYGAGATTPLVKKIVPAGMNFEHEYDSRGEHHVGEAERRGRRSTRTTRWASWCT